MSHLHLEVADINELKECKGVYIMPVPSGWSVTNPDENPRYETKVNETPAEHHCSVSCTPGEDDDGNPTYPLVTNYNFRRVEGFNIGIRRHTDNDPPRRVGMYVYQSSTDEQQEGQENVVEVEWHGLDANGKDASWPITVTMEVCP